MDIWDKLFFEQREQYPKTHKMGILHHVGYTPGGHRVENILYYKYGELLGILNYYTCDIPGLEKKGNILLQVHPNHRRRGIGTMLLDECYLHNKINFEQQEYSPTGKLFIEKYNNYLSSSMVHQKLDDYEN